SPRGGTRSLLPARIPCPVCHSPKAGRRARALLMPPPARIPSHKVRSTMNEHRVGLWMIGAFGGVGTTAALGLAALGRGLTDTTSMVTALPMFEALGLDQPAQFVVGGHDVRRGSFRQTVRGMQSRSNVFEPALAEPCLPQLDEWAANVRPGTVLNAGDTIRKLADLPEAHHTSDLRTAVGRVQTDLQEFRETHRLDQVVVLNVASTEPPFPLRDFHQSLERLTRPQEC